MTTAPVASQEIGANNPPRYEMFSMALDEVRLEAGNFLDGAPIENQGQADAIGTIVSKAKQIKRDADLARKEDKEPHLEAGRQVDDDYRPVLDTCDTIVKAAQAPLTAYLMKLADEQAAAERIARAEAAQAQAAALAAEYEAQGSVEAVEAAKTLRKAADGMTKDAKRAGKAKAHVAGVDRAIGLRSYKVATVTDRKALLQHIMRHDPEPLTGWLTGYAQRALPSQLPGVTVTSENRL